MTADGMNQSSMDYSEKAPVRDLRRIPGRSRTLAPTVGPQSLGQIYSKNGWQHDPDWPNQCIAEMERVRILQVMVWGTCVLGRP